MPNEDKLREEIAELKAKLKAKAEEEDDDKKKMAAEEEDEAEKNSRSLVSEVMAENKKMQRDMLAMQYSAKFERLRDEGYTVGDDARIEKLVANVVGASEPAEQFSMLSGMFAKSIPTRTGSFAAAAAMPGSHVGDDTAAQFARLKRDCLTDHAGNPEAYKKAFRAGCKEIGIKPDQMTVGALPRNGFNEINYGG